MTKKKEKRLFSSGRMLLLLLISAVAVIVQILGWPQRSATVSFLDRPPMPRADKPTKQQQQINRILRQNPTTTTRTETASPTSVSLHKSSSYTFSRHLPNSNKTLQWYPSPNMLEEFTNNNVAHLGELEKLFFSTTKDGGGGHTRNPNYQTALQQGEKTSATKMGCKDASATAKTTDMVSFIRIPKTGSTTLMKLLRLMLAPLTSHLVENHKAVEAPSLGCTFGAIHKPEFDNNETKTKLWACSHLPWRSLLKRLGRVMPYWAEPQMNDLTAQQASFPLENRQAVSFHPFAIARDPWDHLVSLFGYLHGGLQHKARNKMPWGYSFSEYQTQLMKQGNLTGWLEDLMAHRAFDKIFVLQQYSYLSRNVAMAQTQLQQGWVIGMVTECLDLSIQFLADTFPTVFVNPAHVQEVLHQERQTHANRGRWRKKNIDNDDNNLSLLRERLTRDHLQPHYEFYDTLIQTFQRHVKDTIRWQQEQKHQETTWLLNPKDARQCWDRLEQQRRQRLSRSIGHFNKGHQEEQS